MTEAQYIAEKIPYRGGYIDETTDFGSENDRRSDSKNKKIRKYLWGRQKGYCDRCHKALAPLPFEQIKSWLSIHIHHLDGVASHNLASNLALYHAECHWAANAQLQSDSVHGVGKTIEKTANVLSPTSNDPVATASRILDSSVDFWKLFYEEVWEDLLEARKMGVDRTKSDLRQDAVTYSGCKRETSYGYIDFFFSPRFGPLKECIDITGNPFVDFFDRADKTLSVEQLKKKYPLNGLRLGKA